MTLQDLIVMEEPSEEATKKAQEERFEDRYV